VPLTREDGIVRGWIGMHIDVNEHREAERALREADQRKDEFLALLAHELRNPLAAIRSSVAVRNTAPGEAEMSSFTWAIVDRQSAHMVRMINDLLDIVRIDRGKLRLKRSSVSLNSCIQEVADAVRARIDAGNLKLTIDLPEKPIYVYADAERLVQVLDNLLRNAIDFTDAGGEITIRSRQEDKHAKLTVKDTGIGMEPEQIEGLFEPYRQGGRGSGDRGLGLGLALVRQLVGLHEGTVVARSRGPGTGSEFEVVIPLASEVSADTLDEQALPPPRQVVVVDDDADVADSFAGVLRNLGQNVEVAYHGEQALEFCRKERPEIAFIDLAMPGMDGYELARHLRGEPGLENLCLVALSGFSLDTRDNTNEFDRHLLKPADVESLAALLKSLPRQGDESGTCRRQD
jgi:two-component system, chemotaxis family, CheB/CheR fusion protein